MKEVVIDLMSSNGAQGEVANKLYTQQNLQLGAMKPFMHTNGKSYVSIFNGGDPKKKESYSIQQVQTNATLRRDEWKQLDEAIMEISRQRLGGIEDLIEKGLTYNLGNAMGTTMLEWHDISDFGEADMSMDGISRGRNDRPEFQHNYLPIPIIHMDYEINARALSTSRNMGNPLDTLGAERAARRVKEKVESLLFSNVTYSFGAKDERNRNTIYSYLNHPDRNLLALGTAWPVIALADRGATIVAKVSAAKAASIAALHYGPWMLYIPSSYETVMDEDYSTAKGSNTIRERIMQIGGIQGIKVIDTLPANNVVLVQMTSDVVRLVRGFPLQTVQWGSEGNLVTNYKVMTIQVPQIRSDQNGKSGIVHIA